MHSRHETAVLSVADIQRFQRNVRHGQHGCWEWAGRRRKGYGSFVFERPSNSDRRMQAIKLAHHVAFFLAHGRWPTAGMVVMHGCDNKGCVNPEHLREGTYAENSADMVAKKRQAFGERQHKAKLTESDVLEIRRLSAAGVTNKEIALRFKVANSNVSMIVSRTTWKHLK